MSPTKARVIQYVVIITILALVSGAGYAWYSTRAAINSKAATNNGLVGYWSFDEGSGTQAGDASGFGNTGTLVGGPSWVSGRFGKALQFTSSGNVDVTVADNPALRIGQKITISAWVKPTSRNTNGSLIIQKRDAVNINLHYNYGFWLDSTGKIFFQFHDGSYRDFTGTTPVPLNVWTFVTVAVDETAGTKVTFYQNGVTDGTPAYAGTMPSSGTAPLQVGNYGQHIGGILQFNGSLDEVRIYNRALTGAEITNLYNLGAAKVNATENSNLTNGLVGLWSFNGADVSGTTAYDRSGSSNNGTLTNGPAPALGKLGQALSFDGTDDYIRVSNASSLQFTSATSITLSSWVNPSQITGYNTFLVKGRDTDSTETNYALRQDLSGKKLDFYYNQSGNTSWSEWVTTSDVFPVRNQWYHVAVTYTFGTGSSIKAYVNGVSVAGGWTSGNGNEVPDASTQALFIARVVAGEYFSGLLDETRIYNRALSESEIRDLYQLGASDKVNSADAQSDPLERGLVGYWRLDENTGTTTTDASGNGNTGTLTNGPTWTAGRIGSGVNFDGTDDYITMGAPSALNLTGPLTISAWIYPTSFGGASKGRIFDKDADVIHGYGLFVDNANVSSGFTFFTETSIGARYSAAGAITLNTWQHVVASFDGTNVTLYSNGAVSNGAQSIAAPTSGTNNAVIGGKTTASDRNFAGSIDEVRIYNRALSAEEVAKLYQTTTPDNPDTGLKGYWSFDGKDVSGTTAYDRSGSGASGTLTNGPTPTIGKLGQALSFDGTNDCVASVANSPDLAALTQASVAFWIKPKIFLNRTIFTLLQTNGGGNGAFVNGFEIGSNIWTSTEAIRLAVDGTSVDLQARSNSLLSLNVWTHVVVTWGGAINGTDTKFYFNGTDVGTTVMQAGSGSYVAGDGRYKIGSAPECAYGFLDGTLDDLRVYNRVLTATEITNLYNQGR